MFKFTKFSKLWLTISTLAVAASIAVIAIFGLNFGIDFTGGSLMEIKFEEPVEVSQVSETLENSPLEIGLPIVTPAADDGHFILRFRYLETEEEQTQLQTELTDVLGSFELERFTTTGPTLGKTLQERALRALTYTSIAIVLYLAAVFRNKRRDGVGKYVGVASLMAFLAILTETMDVTDATRWLLFAATAVVFLVFLVLELRGDNPSLKYGVAAIVALLHDIIVTLGVLVIVGQLFDVEISALTVTALLAIMGFSVNDTIVVFDRLRENLKYQKAGQSLHDVADISLNQTVARSINTSVSTLIVLVVLFWLGAESIRWFVGALVVGTIVGTYSSIFLATPLLVEWEERK